MQWKNGNHDKSLSSLLQGVLAIKANEVWSTDLRRHVSPYTLILRKSLVLSESICYHTNVCVNKVLYPSRMEFSRMGLQVTADHLS